MASNFVTVQACHIPPGFTSDTKIANEPHSNACQQQQSALLSPAERCCHLPKCSCTCDRSPQTFCAAPNKDVIPPSRQDAAHQSMEAAAAWRGFLAHQLEALQRRRALTRWRLCSGSCAAVQLLRTLCSATTWRLCLIQVMISNGQQVVTCFSLCLMQALKSPSLDVQVQAKAHGSSSSRISRDCLHGWVGGRMSPSLLALRLRRCTPCLSTWRLLQAARPYTCKWVVSSWTALLQIIT
jgi:hypothetical protein